MTTTPVMLQKTGYRAIFNGKAFAHKTADISMQAGGLIEACHDVDLTRELTTFGKMEYWDENIGFIAAVNHLLRRRTNTATKLARSAGLTRAGSMDDHMQQVFDLYIATSGDKSINIDYTSRLGLSRQWSSIKAGQDVRSLLTSRSVCVSLAISNMERTLKRKVISKRLAKVLGLSESPTDAKVMAKLGNIMPAAANGGTDLANLQLAPTW